MSSRLEQARRRVLLELGKIQRWRSSLASADAALAEYSAALSSALGEHVTGMDDVHEILVAVCAEYRIIPTLVLGESRPSSVIEPRHMAMALACELTTHATSRLGLFFQKNHGAILGARDAVRDRCLTDPGYSRRYARMLQTCRTALSKLAASGSQARTA